MHSVRSELAKLILVGPRITYQATRDAGLYTGNLGCLTWSSGSEPIIVAYTPARAVINATPQCMLARYSFDWLGDNYVQKPEG